MKKIFIDINEDDCIRIEYKFKDNTKLIINNENSELVETVEKKLLIIIWKLF